MHHIGKPNWRFGIRPLQRLGNDRPRGAEHGSSFRPITSRDVAKLPLLTIGAQFQGSNNNTIGQQATVDVFLSISEIVKDAVAKREDRRLTLRNASDRKVIIVLASDPDVRIQEEFGNTLCNNVVIEIKGGSDRSTLTSRRPLRCCSSAMTCMSVRGACQTPPTHPDRFVVSALPARRSRRHPKSGLRAILG
jgi:hypothetical protein